MAKERVTIRDIANLAGTSTATISYYLNGKYEKMSAQTRKTIESAIDKTGYVPNVQARLLSGKKTGVISVLILDNTNDWSGQLINGIEDTANANGYQTVLCNSNFQPDREHLYVEKMLSLGADGFIIQPTAQFKAINNRISRAGKPVVFYDCNLFDFKTSWIKTNLYDGVYSATSECIERGYKQFILIAANFTGSAYRTRIERAQGFSDAVTAHNLEYRELNISHGAPSISELEHWFKYELNTSKRTLIFVSNQWALSRVFQALKSQIHLIPDRVGLLGINNQDWSNLTSPSISTIIEPVREEGRLACEMLIKKLKNNDIEPQQKVLKCTTRWLDSTL